MMNKDRFFFSVCVSFLPTYHVESAKNLDKGLRKILALLKENIN